MGEYTFSNGEHYIIVEINTVNFFEAKQWCIDNIGKQSLFKSWFYSIDNNNTSDTSYLFYFADYINDYCLQFKLMGF